VSPASADTRDALRRIYEWWTYERALPAHLFLAILLASALSPMQSDTWWQLRAGGDMWASGRVLLTDNYSHTAYGSFWPNHEWLAEVIFFAVYKIGGLPLLSLFTAALVLPAWAIVWRLTRGPSRRRFVLIACALPVASMHWEPRPHAFSLLFVMITVALLLRRRDAWLPVVFWIWANCHGGVLVGLVVLIAALASDLLDGTRAWRPTLLLVAGCCVAVTLTPLGTSLWGELIRSIERIRRYPLDEWKRPAVSDVRLLPYWLTVVGLLVVLLRRWRGLRAPGHRATRLLCVCAVAVLPLSISAVRGVGTFLMLAVPAIAGVWSLDPVEQDREYGAGRPALNAALAFSASLMVVVTLGCAYWYRIARLQWTPLPAASIRAVQECPGNLYNRYDEGGYLIWFAPDRPVFLDGRQDPYPSSLVLEQIEVEASGDFERLFDRHHIRCAFLPTISPLYPRLMAAGWSPLYHDRDWAVLADEPGRDLRARSLASR
jgi:hypothetical protein